MSFIDSMKFIQVIRDDADALSAKPEDCLEGRIFVGAAKKFQTGNIPVLENRSNRTLLAGESYSVPFGYNSLEYVVKAVSLADQTAGDAAASHLLLNKIAWSNGSEIVGTMPNNDAVSITLDAGESYPIELGYHNGNGKISAASLASQTVGTAIAGDILLGKLAWVNGKMIAGTMNDNQPKEITINAGVTFTIAEGYHHGNGSVIAESLADQTLGSATASDIIVDKTAWVNGVLVTGTIPKFGKQTIALPINGSYTIPYGVHPGTEVVTQNIATQAALTLTPAFDDQTINVANKYMLGDITLTGINALNFNNFTSTKSAHYDGKTTISSMIQTLSREVYRIAVDNWHDQATDNIYAITITMNRTDGNYSVSGTIFANNLNSDHLASESVSLITKGLFGDTNISVVVSLDPTTNAHVFTLKGAITQEFITAGLLGSSISVRIVEIMQLRRYGDDHDK